jgi:hypothetical protein
MKEHHVSIWFLIGLQLSIYGLLIGGASIYDWLNPSTASTVVLAQYHAGVWLSLVMLILGLIYTKKYWPRRR